MAKQFRIIVNEQHCKQCGICSYFCPKNVLAQAMGQSPVAERPDDCIGCRLCELRCPDFAIEVEVRQ